MDPREPLALYGLDSLRSVELEALLEDAFHRHLPVDLADHASLDALVGVLEGGGRRARARDADHARALMRADGVLPFDIRPAAAPRAAPRAVRVLLTGAHRLSGRTPARDAAGRDRRGGPVSRCHRSPNNPHCGH